MNGVNGSQNYQQVPGGFWTIDLRDGAKIADKHPLIIARCLLVSGLYWRGLRKPHFIRARSS
jgi:hypothetical protein